VIELLEELGIENGWIQEMSAPENYRPDLSGEVILYLNPCASTICIDEA